MMAEYLPLSSFKAIYVVDLCHSLCEQARLKVKEAGWANVHVVEGDACEFRVPDGEAHLVTFSYSLSSECGTRAAPWRSPPCGLLGLQQRQQQLGRALPVAPHARSNIS